uniref:Uncharacterized protein n=1 Tax=Aegilops tauschii subsp. strangulata TaxID=200361 RepID=A0A452Z574_AEGTS
MVMLYVRAYRPTESKVDLCLFDGTHAVRIESVVGKENVGSDVMGTTGEMVVVWIENQLHENKTKELILQ